MLSREFNLFSFQKNIIIPCLYLNVDDGKLSFEEFKNCCADGILNSEDLWKLFNDIDRHHSGCHSRKGKNWIEFFPVLLSVVRRSLKQTMVCSLQKYKHFMMSWMILDLMLHTMFSLYFSWNSFISSCLFKIPEYSTYSPKYAEENAFGLDSRFMLNDLFFPSDL
uniref:Uncharacterized protein n=1 Tax=Laticauda laticaudata TaxID=8630 RepID=A0A8C5SG59_LATLA